MKEFVDRIPTMPNRYKITKENGGAEYAIIERADGATVEGTPLNREAFMALQGFQETKTVFNADGSISELNAKNEELKTVFNADGSITKTFTSEKGVVISLKTVFQTNGSIKEVFV